MSDAIIRWRTVPISEFKPSPAMIYVVLIDLINPRIAQWRGNWWYSVPFNVEKIGEYITHVMIATTGKNRPIEWETIPVAKMKPVVGLVYIALINKRSPAIVQWRGDDWYGVQVIGEKILSGITHVLLPEFA